MRAMEKVMAEDIVERLEYKMLPGNCDDMAMVDLLGDCLTEIKRLRADIVALRSLAGCVEIPLKSLADIKKEIRNG